MQFHLDGRLHEAGTPALPADDRGLTLGDGAFETIAVTAGHARRLPWHLDRLEDALRTLRFAPAPERQTLARAVDGVLAANGLRDGVIRLTVTRGSGPRGPALPAECRPRVLATASVGLPAQAPVHVIVTRTVRRDPSSPLSRIKSLSYLDSVMARAEADAAGTGEALIANTQGRIAEAATANVFAQIDGALVTPPTAEGCLPGIGRRAILEVMPVRELALTTADLLRAEAVFLTSSIGARAVLSVDGRPVGDARRTGVMSMAERVIADAAC